MAELYMGNVYQASLGQNPARQAALFAGLFPVFLFLVCVLSCYVDHYFICFIKLAKLCAAGRGSEKPVFECPTRSVFGAYT